MLRSAFASLSPGCFSPMPSSPAQNTATPVLERAFDVGAEERCRLRVPRAAVTLAPAAGEGRATVALAATAGTAPGAARALVETLCVRHAEGVLRVEPEHPPRPTAAEWRTLRDGAPRLALDVRVPASFGAEVHAPGGRIEARGLGGSVTLGATSGRIRATGLTGRLDVRAERCQATVEDFDGEACRAHVHGGSLTMKSVAAAKTVEVESRAARLRVEEVRGALDLTQQGGSSRIGGVRGALDARVCGGRCHLTPVSGCAARLHAPGSEAHLALPDGHAADLCLSAYRLRLGALASRLDEEPGARRAEGVLDEGGAPVKVHAPGGAVRVR
jgi:hypothetical protein